ncbi:MAG: hypothetical protein ACKPKO_22010, partial [Candidatus Fonsibacter sp.]
MGKDDGEPVKKHQGHSLTTYSSVDKLPTRRQSKAETSVADYDDGSESVSTDGGHTDDVGTLASVA